MREEGIGSCRALLEWRHTPLGAAGMHPFLLAACRVGCKQWRKSCIVAARIVSRKAVTLSSGSCTVRLPLPLPLPLLLSRSLRHPSFAGSKGWRGPPIPPRYLQRKQILAEISFTEYYLSEGWLSFLLLCLWPINSSFFLFHPEL